MVTMEKSKTHSDLCAIGGFLPHDLVIEILTMIPVTSLLRFSCVSKSWNLLISSQEFIKAQLRYAANKFQYTRIMLTAFNHDFHHFSPHEPVVRVFPAKHNVEGFPFNTLVGSCHGLICIAVSTECRSIGNDIVLWNPSTRKSKKLPRFNDEHGYKSEGSYGFGYDESCDDYKVVRFYYSTKRYTYNVLVKIFSLKTGEFKTIEGHDIPTLGLPYPKLTFANGKLHWFVQLGEIVVNMRTRTVWAIAYLNIETEEYGMLEKHDSVGGDGFCMTALSGGSLCVSCYFDPGTDIWLVKSGYGAGKTTWTKVIRYPYVDGIMMLSSLFVTPLVVLDNGEIMMLRSNKIVIINPKDCSIKYPEVRNSQKFRQGIAYVESLISP